MQSQTPPGMPGLQTLQQAAERVTELARVPKQDSGHVYNGMYDLIRNIWVHAGPGPACPPSDALDEAYRAVQILNEAIPSLSDGDRRILQVLLVAEPPFHLQMCPVPERMKELVRLVDDLTSLISLANGKSGPPTMPGTAQQGTQKGAVEHPTFQGLIRYLRILMREWDGDLTFDQDHPERSTLLDALDILRPCLPAGMVPARNTSLRAIQDIVIEQNKTWSD
jgi:hypothetical protein